MTWVEKGGFIVILLLLSIAPVMAQSAGGFTASDLNFTRNEHTVTVISTEHPRLAEAHFKLMGSFFDSLIFDATPLGETNGWKTIVMGTNEQGSCHPIQGGHQCTVDDLMLMPASGSGVIPLEIHVGNKTSKASLSFSFQVDNTAPTVGDILTGECKSGEQCYIGGGLLDIEIELVDSQATFDQGLIFFRVGNMGPYMVNNCTGFTCSGKASSNCQHGSDVNIFLASFNGVPSQDDAGNPVESGFVKTVRCDRVPPKVEEITMESDTGLPVVVKGDTAMIKATIRDDTPVKASANFIGFAGVNEVTTVDCQGGESQTCDFSVPVNQQGYRTFDVEFLFTDSGGNTFVKRETFEILKLQTSIGNITDLWNVNNVICSPNTINARTLRFFEKRIFCTVETSKTYPDQEVISQEIPPCSVVNGNTATQPRIVHQGQNPTMYFTIPTSIYDLNDSSLNMDCNMTTVTRRGNYLVSPDEIDAFAFEIKFTEFDDMPARLHDELQDIQRKNADYERIQGKIKKWVDLITNVCRTFQTIKSIEHVLGDFEVVACAWGILGQPASEALAEAGKIQEKTSDGIWGGVGKFCSFITCDWGWSQKVRDNVFFGISQGMQPGDWQTLGLTSEELFRPENSIVWSYATACVPGVLDNMEKKQVIECEYERCLREDSIELGIPSASCKITREQNRCRYYSGQFINAIPWTHVWQNVGETVLAAISNPFGMLGFGGAIVTKAACQPLTACAGGHWACAIPKAVSSGGAIKEMIDNGIRAIESFGTISDDTPLCQRVDELEELRLFDPLIDLAGYCKNGICGNSYMAVDAANRLRAKVHTFTPNAQPQTSPTASTSTDSPAPGTVEETVTVRGVVPTTTLVQMGGEYKIYTKQTGSDGTIAYLGDAFDISTGTISETPSLELVDNMVGSTDPLIKDLVDRERERMFEDAKLSESESLLSFPVELDRAAEAAWGVRDDLIKEREVWRAKLLREERILRSAERALKDTENEIATFNVENELILDDEQINEVLVELDDTLADLEVEIALSQESEQDIRDHLEIVDEQIKEIEDEYGETIKNYRNAIKAQNAFTSRDLASALRIGRGWVSATSWFMDTESGFLKEWSDFIYEYTGRVLDIQSTAADLLCDEIEDLETVGVVAATQELNYRPAIHLEGFRQKSNITGLFEYFVTALVSAPEGTDETPGEVEFIIELRPGPKQLQGRVTLDHNSDPYQRETDNPLQLQIQKIYSEVCIKFNTVSSGAYGDEVLRSGSSYCNTIEESKQRG